jgi:tetratricopeptide (TPR) repeat protein
MADIYTNLREKMEESPDSLVFARLAELLYQTGKKKASFAILEKGIFRFPKYTTGHLIMGKLLQQEENLDKAYKSLLKALELEPHNLGALFEMAKIAFKKENYNLFLSHILQVLTLNPFSERAIDLLKQGWPKIYEKDKNLANRLLEMKVIKSFTPEPTELTVPEEETPLEKGIAEEVPVQDLIEIPSSESTEEIPVLEFRSSEGKIETLESESEIIEPEMIEILTDETEIKPVEESSPEDKDKSEYIEKKSEGLSIEQTDTTIIATTKEAALRSTQREEVIKKASKTSQDEVFEILESEDFDITKSKDLHKDSEKPEKISSEDIIHEVSIKKQEGKTDITYEREPGIIPLEGLSENFIAKEAEQSTPEKEDDESLVMFIGDKEIPLDESMDIKGFHDEDVLKDLPGGSETKESNLQTDEILGIERSQTQETEELILEEIDGLTQLGEYTPTTELEPSKDSGIIDHLRKSPEQNKGSDLTISDTYANPKTAEEFARQGHFPEAIQIYKLLLDDPKLPSVFRSRIAKRIKELQALYGQES